MQHIGFVGLGHMGLPMAINLVHAGHQVTGFDLNAEACFAFKRAGGLVASSLSALAAEQDVIITMLQTGKQVHQVCMGPEGLFAYAKKNTLMIDCSSIDVRSAREWHQQAIEHQLFSLDAPVSGGIAGAAAGTLTIMMGGSEHAMHLAEPVLKVMGTNLINTGAEGNGQAAKICNNMILGISMIAVSEAFILAKGLGLPAQKLFDVVTNASGQCWAMSKYVPLPGILPQVPANNDYQPGFTAAMMLKDLRVSQNCAQEHLLNTPLGAQATAIYEKFAQEGHGESDFSAIIKQLGYDKV